MWCTSCTKVRPKAKSLKFSFLGSSPTSLSPLQPWWESPLFLFLYMWYCSIHLIVCDAYASGQQPWEMKEEMIAIPDKLKVYVWAQRGAMVMLSAPSVVSWSESSKMLNIVCIRSCDLVWPCCLLPMMYIHHPECCHVLLLADFPAVDEVECLVAPAVMIIASIAFAGWAGCWWLVLSSHDSDGSYCICRLSWLLMVVVLDGVDWWLVVVTGMKIPMLNGNERKSKNVGVNSLSCYYSWSDTWYPWAPCCEHGSVGCRMFVVW